VACSCFPGKGKVVVTSQYSNSNFLYCYFCVRRSLTSVLSDLPDGANLIQQDTAFDEGMKIIYDALHPGFEEESSPTKLYPYRGNGSLKLRRSSTSLSTRGKDARQ